MGSNQGRDVEKEVLRKKVKELESENRGLRTRISGIKSTGATPGGKAPMSAAKTRPRTSTVGAGSGPPERNVPIGRT